MAELFKEWGGQECHLYKDVKRPWVEYIPVSTVKKHYCNEFPPDMLQKCTDNPRYRLYGKTKEEIQAVWTQEAVDGKEHGTKIHYVIEQWIESGFKWVGGSSEERELVKWFSAVAEKIGYNELFTSSEKTTWLDVCSKETIIRDGQLCRRWTRPIIETTSSTVLLDAIFATKRAVNEKGVFAWFDINPVECACFYLLDFGLAGTIDILREGARHDNIDDIKTDQIKNMKETGFRGQRMNGVLSHLQDCALEQYFIQVHLYGFMNSRMTGRGFGSNNYIVHIPKENDRFRKNKVILVKDRRKEAVDVIADFFLSVN